jgi:hypothetical protein
MSRGSQYVILVGVLIVVVFAAFIGIALMAGEMSRHFS